MSSCSRCAVVARPANPTGTLFLAAPLGHTQRTLIRALEAAGIPAEARGALILAVELTAGRFEAVLDVGAGCLGEVERRDTRAFVLKDGASPSIDDIMNTMPLAMMIAQFQERWLADMIHDHRLTTHFQPIVRAGATDQVHAYECLLRGKKDDGSLIAPLPMYDAARNADLLFQLDRAARLTAIREAIKHRIREMLFINFNPSSIYDPAFCLKSTIAAIETARIHPSRIVFEVVESDQVDVDLLGIITTYRRAGFRVALDDLGAGYGSLNLLSRLRPDIVKLDMKLIRDVHKDPYKAGITSTLLEMARKLGIETVAEGIETPEELAWVQDHGVDFVQGYFIGRPASPPPRPRPAPANVANPVLGLPMAAS